MSLKDLIATPEQIEAWRTSPLDKLFVKFVVDPTKMYCEHCGWEIYLSQRFKYIQTGKTERFKQCVKQHGIATYHKTCFQIKDRLRRKVRIYRTKSQQRIYEQEYQHQYYLDKTLPKRKDKSCRNMHSKSKSKA